MVRRQRRTFTAEQKADAVRMARELGNIAEASRVLGIGDNSLRSWIRQADIDEGRGPKGALTSEEREDYRRLRQDYRQLEMERDFLKKAAVFFAKEEDRRTR